MEVNSKPAQPVICFGVNSSAALRKAVIGRERYDVMPSVTFRGIAI